MAEINENLRNTALYKVHEELGAKFCSFNGWNMPIQYSSIITEHRYVREMVGLFDLGHMGEIRITGERATEFLYHVVSVDPTTMEVGDLRYALLLNDSAGVLDDIVISRLEDGYLIIANASNREHDYEWLKEHCFPGVGVTDLSDELGMIAIQGPRSVDVLAALIEQSKFQKLPFYTSICCSLAGTPIILCRSGYTGEDGFEIISSNAYAHNIWAALSSTESGFTVRPIGLGARDTLRLEMGYSLYGHELTLDTNPLEAGLRRFLDMTKTDFIGKAALARILKKKPSRKLVGLKVIGRGIIREGYDVCNGNGEKVGHVTSGTISPTLNASIGMAYVATDHARLGTQLSVDVRSKAVDVYVAKKPFVEPRTYKEG